MVHFYIIFEAASDQTFWSVKEIDLPISFSQRGIRFVGSKEVPSQRMVLIYLQNMILKKFEKLKKITIFDTVQKV